MKTLLKFIVLIEIIVFFPPFVLANISGEQDVTVTYYHVEGNTGNSFYPENKVTYLYEGQVDFTRSFLSKELFGSMSYRVTDDRLVDLQDVSLEEFFIGLRKDSFEFLAGDFYSSFSGYSVDNALKGLRLNLGEDDLAHFKLAAGVDTSRWENLWETRCDDSDTRKYVWGFQLGNSFFDKDLKLNLNYGGSLDDKAFLSSGSPQVLVDVVSLDTAYRINDVLSSSFEFAHSFTDADKNLDEVKTKNDYAGKAVLDLNTRNYSLLSLYSRIGSNFNSTSGFTAADLETISFDGAWYAHRNVKLTHYLHLDRDNLSDHLYVTTRQINPGVILGLSLPREVNCDIGFDSRKRYSTDKYTNDETQAYSVNLGKNFQVFYGNIGYTRTVVKDKVDLAQERDVDTITLGLDGDFTIREVIFSWNIAEDINHEDYKEAGKADLFLTHSLGMRADFPSALSIEARVNLSDSDYYSNSLDNNTANYVFSISRCIKDNLTFSVNYDYKDYAYPDGDDNYSETVMTAKAAVRF
ncbi:MAG: hypothetical protein U9Q24_00895 [Candidatus Ratteibacteria bacterium]|nr:hypothetical protein [Candidatus Ratteibacteria bacterium]